MVNKKILELLEQDSRISTDEIATMLKLDEKKVKTAIKEMEDEKVILKYTTVIDREKIPGKEDTVTALIEVQVRPERGKGFDSIAERLYRFPEVRSLYLLSGGFDLMLVIESTDLKSVASFVYDKLATLENVKSTATHFLLKKYKENGTILAEEEKSERLAIVP